MFSTFRYLFLIYVNKISICLSVNRFLCLLLINSLLENGIWYRYVELKIAFINHPGQKLNIFSLEQNVKYFQYLKWGISMKGHFVNHLAISPLQRRLLQNVVGQKYKNSSVSNFCKRRCDELRCNRKFWKSSKRSLN